MHEKMPGEEVWHIQGEILRRNKVFGIYKISVGKDAFTAVVMI